MKKWHALCPSIFLFLFLLRAFTDSMTHRYRTFRISNANQVYIKHNVDKVAAKLLVRINWVWWRTVYLLTKVILFVYFLRSNWENKHQNNTNYGIHCLPRHYRHCFISYTTQWTHKWRVKFRSSQPTPCLNRLVWVLLKTSQPIKNIK